MWKIIITVGIWVIGFICVVIMRKIEPGNKIYPVWALFVAIAFTLSNFCNGLC